jgi:hypothetical protein
MELYAFSGAVIHKVLTMVVPETGSTGDGLATDLSGPLQFLFSVRAVNFDLQIGLT